MCGIYGIIQLDGKPADAAWLPRMGRVTTHRGPDDEGMHASGPCAIGMRRLSIIDLAGGHQPISSQDGRLWLVCNGEIYNFRELRRELEARGHRFKTHSDSEVVLYAYIEYGDSFVERLNGMFGFALWDGVRQRLLIGRDRLGIKPLYLANDGKRLAFASEAKALLELPGVERDLDPAALASYLQLGYVPAPQSLFRSIRKLPPATVLAVESGRVEARRYWQVPSDVDHGLSEGEWIERLRARMEQSVRMQMVSDVPLGAFLSGGVDSSGVVAFMARASADPIKTYAIGFGGSRADDFYNELPYARRVAELFGTEHREIVVKPDVVSLLPRLLWHMDEPVADTAFITTYLVSEFARRDVTVILSGVGGDELFGGYRRYLGNHYQAQFERLPRWMRAGATALGEKLPSDRHSPVLNLLRLAKGFLASTGQSFETRYGSYVQVFSPHETEQLQRIKDFDRYDAIESAFRGATSDDALNRMMVVDAETQLPDDLLMLTDKMSMATSLECRVPLLDHELVELAARMPEEVKMRGGRLKHAMKAALAGVLPPDILERKKRGFGTPMGAWLKTDLKPLLTRVLDEPSVTRRALFDYTRVRKLVADHEANRIDGTDRLLSLMNLEIWSRIYLDRRTPDDVTAELKGMLGVKILYVCHRFPFPPRFGGTIRPFNMIRHLSINHEVTVASLARSDEEAEEGRGLAAYCARIEIAQVRKPVQFARMVARLPTPTPSSMGFFYSSDLAHRVRTLLSRERFDLIFVHCSSVAQYVAHRSDVPKILDFGDMDSRKWLEYARYKLFPLSMGYWLEGVKMERAERQLAARFDMCTATTRAELDTLESYRVDVPTDWFPNGVDSTYFAPVDEPHDADTISFVGRMNYYPNQECMFDFCANTLPLLRRSRPNVKLLIVGADPSAAVLKLGELPGVTVTGSVPDVRPYVRASAAMVAPLNIARGTQNKILEAMAMEVPVVTSPAAAGGVDARDREHFVVARMPQEYAEALLRLMGDPAERRRLAESGRARMLTHHAWDRSMRRLDGIIENCLATHSRREPGALLRREL